MAFSMSICRSHCTLTRLISRVALQENCMTKGTVLSRTPQLHRHPVSSPSLFPARPLHLTHSRKGTAYEPDGKTTVTVLNDEQGAPLMINSYNRNGFKLNNGMRVLGPIAIFPKTVLGWDVGCLQDITPQSLALFAIIEPKPDVLVLGIGDQGAQLPLETLQFLKKRRINVEILSTHHACSTFNFLSGEGRCAAAAIIPPSHVAWTGMDIANSKIKRKEIYEDDDL